MSTTVVDHSSLIAFCSESVDRTTALRTRCRQRKQLCGANEYRRYLSAQSLMQSTLFCWQRRMGLRALHVLQNMPLEIDDLELLIGRPAHFPAMLSDGLNDADQLLASLPPSPGQTGHCELDLSRIFSVGIDGLSAELSHLAQTTRNEQAYFYLSTLDALQGLSDFIERAADTVKAASLSASANRQVELSEIATSCRRIAHNPPSSFRDAIQLLWFVDLAVMIADGAGLVVPGHLDRTLWPFYEQDIAAGVITRAEALELIECLYVLINEFIPDGLAMSVMVGGRNTQGLDITNDLSFICLEALSRTRMIYPTVGICCHDGTPLGLIDLAIDLIVNGLTTPAFFNDDTIQLGLRTLGVPEGDTCNYINSTCVEITPVGASNVWVASPYFNLPGILLEEIKYQSTSPTVMSFDDFLRSYQKRLTTRISEAVADQNHYRAQRRAAGRKPLQSIFTRGCLERGQDIDDGGAIYNWVECSFVGLANLADSLIVIKREVFESKFLALNDLHQILDSNYSGCESVRQRFIGRYPKYGNANAEVDGIVQQMTIFLRDECAQHRMLPGDSPFVPGTFCWIMHEQLGKATGATPDGRTATVALADAAGPAQGRELNGPTAAIRSITSWDHSMMMGGLAYNMKFSSALFTDTRSRGHLRSLILTYLRLGGFETQINILNREMLLLARQHPDQYADLVVRIGGYCDYFTRLSPRMQDELIMRAEYDTF